MKPRDSKGRYTLQNPSEVMQHLNAALRNAVHNDSNPERTAELQEILKQARGEQPPTQEISLDDLLRRIVVGPADTSEENK